MKQLIPNYTFNPTSKTITFTDFSSIALNRVLLITNVNTNTVIYNFAQSGRGGTIVGNVLTLDYDTTAMSGTDDLAILYETARGDPDYERFANVETEVQTLREDFDGGSLDTTAWSSSVGAGGSVAVASSLLNIGAGTTANSVVTVRSLKSFTLPCRLIFTASLSQRIANNSFELALTNAAGTTLASWLLDGVTATQAKVVAQHATFKATADTTVTVATTTGYLGYELDLRADAVDYNERATESNGVATNRATRTRTIPEPGEEYFIQIRSTNGAVAPASNTTLSIDNILMQDSTKFVVEVAAGRGNNVPGRGVATYLAGGSVAVSGSVSLALPSTSNATNPGATVTNILTATAASANVANIKAAVGKVVGWDLHNKSTVVRYLKLYNTATTPTMGTTSALFQIPIPAGARSFMPASAISVQFATGIAYAVTEAASLTDNTIAGIAANDVVGTVFTV